MLFLSYSLAQLDTLYGDSNGVIPSVCPSSGPPNLLVLLLDPERRPEATLA